MTYEEPKTLAGIVAEYAPYNGMIEFGEGFVAYQYGIYENPYDGVKASGLGSRRQRSNENSRL